VDSFSALNSTLIPSPIAFPWGKFIGGEVLNRRGARKNSPIAGFGPGTQATSPSIGVLTPDSENTTTPPEVRTVAYGYRYGTITAVNFCSSYHGKSFSIPSADLYCGPSKVTVACAILVEVSTKVLSTHWDTKIIFPLVL